MIKKIKILVLFLPFFLFSCSDSILNSPEQIQKETKTLSSDQRDVAIADNIPATVTKSINGKTGGTITLTGLHIGLDLRIITVNATLTIPPAAFEGTKEITLTADWQTPGIICEPALEFDVPLTLDLLYIGVDLIGLLFNHDNVFFAYLGDDGTIKRCEYEGIDINLLAGLIGVRKAKIEHFSRYGFSR